MKSTRKAAVGALKLWGACQAVRYWTGASPEKIIDARVLEALHANPLSNDDASKDAFHRLAIGQLIKGDSAKDTRGNERQLPAICAVPVKNRREIAETTKEQIREGFGDAPRCGQMYSGAAEFSETARLTFISVDIALQGIYRRFAFWTYVGGQRVVDFEDPELVVAKNATRAKYRLSDVTSEIVMEAIDLPGRTIVQAWAEELNTRLPYRLDDPNIMATILGELAQMEREFRSAK